MRLWPMVFVLGITAAGAQEPRALTAQQQRMKDCNQKAGIDALGGAARRQFMRHCLSGGKVEVQVGEAAAEAAPEAQTPAVSEAGSADPAKAAWRRKLGHCLGEAKTQDLKGSERKAFMSECLKPVTTP